MTDKQREQVIDLIYRRSPNLVRFLIERNLLNKFAYNMFLYMSGNAELQEMWYDSSTRSLISSAFQWVFSVERYTYWYRVDLEWKKSLQ